MPELKRELPSSYTVHEDLGISNSPDMSRVRLTRELVGRIGTMVPLEKVGIRGEGFVFVTRGSGVLQPGEQLITLEMLDGAIASSRKAIFG